MTRVRISAGAYYFFSNALSYIAIVKPGDITYKHKLRGSEVYYILKGKGLMYIDDEAEEVSAGQAAYIPPDSIQRIENIGGKI